MQGMLVHHAQALEMAALVDDRTDSEDVPLLAERITVSQEAEITLIEQWLADRGEASRQTRPCRARAHARHGDTRAAGRAGRRPGAAFDALFLELMIAHHQGALAMVDELYAAGGGLEPAVRPLRARGRGGSDHRDHAHDRHAVGPGIVTTRRAGAGALLRAPAH